MPYAKWYERSGEYLLAGGLLPRASAIALTWYGAPPQHTPMYLSKKERGIVSVLCCDGGSGRCLLDSNCSGGFSKFGNFIASAQMGFEFGVHALMTAKGLEGRMFVIGPKRRKRVMKLDWVVWREGTRGGGGTCRERGGRRWANLHFRPAP